MRTPCSNCRARPRNSLAERWRRPVVPIEIHEHETEGIMLPDGRVLRQPVFVLSAEDMERLRTGYVCAKCFEPFERAWPERCPVCGAPIRTKQAEYFAREFGGEARIGPSTSLDDELASLPERVAKEKEANRNGNRSDD